MSFMLRTSYATFVRSWIVIFRAYPISFFVSGVFSGLCSAALASFSYFLLAGGQVDAHFVIYAGTADYVSYVILGGSILSFATGMLLGISRSLITERREGTLDSLLLSPIQQISYFAGIAAQTTTRCLGETLLLLCLVWPLGLNLSHVQILTLLLTFPVAILGLFGMSVLLGAIMLATGDTYIIQNTLFALMTLVCGFAFPPNYLPSPLQWLGMALPIGGAVRLLRLALLSSTPVSMIWQDLLFYALLGLLYTLVGLSLMKRASIRALEGV